MSLPPRLGCARGGPGLSLQLGAGKKEFAAIDKKKPGGEPGGGVH